MQNVAYRRAELLHHVVVAHGTGADGVNKKVASGKAQCGVIVLPVNELRGGASGRVDAGHPTPIVVWVREVVGILAVEQVLAVPGKLGHHPQQAVRGLNKLGFSERLACQVVGLSPSTYLKMRSHKPSDAQVRRLLLADAIADVHARRAGP